jgi:hypothetical protein
MTRARDAKKKAAQEEMVQVAAAMTTVQGAIDKLMDNPEMREQFAVGAAAKRAAATDSGIEQYDEWMLFNAAIVGWSYKDAAGQAVPVSEETVRDLDTETAEWLKGEIAARNLIGREQGEDSAAG